MLLLLIVGVFAFHDKLIGAIELYSKEGFAGVYYRIKDKIPSASPNVAWITSPPQSLGLDEAKLNEFRDMLLTSNTHALIIVRNNRIGYEYYAPPWGPNVRHSTAALSKTLTGAMLLLVMLNDGKIGLDEPLREYIPVWRNDPLRQNITAHHIVTHSSGIEDVDFTEEHSGWKKAYLDNPDKRFQYAIETAPVLFDAGTQFEYSGVGYYALAYAFGTALRGSDLRNLRQILRDRIMLPLGIPDHDWSVSYDKIYEVDGMPLIAIGSGGVYTPRAIARIGQLLLDNGSWNGKQLIDKRWTDLMMRYGGLPAVRSKDSKSPATGIGLWLNCDRFWRSLPLDAVIGIGGGGHQILLVIPSLDLVVVRTGGSLTDNFWRDADVVFFAPLLAAVINPNVQVNQETCTS